MFELEHQALNFVHQDFISMVVLSLVSLGGSSALLGLTFVPVSCCAGALSGASLGTPEALLKAAQILLRAESAFLLSSSSSFSNSLISSSLSMHSRISVYEASIFWYCCWIFALLFCKSLIVSLGFLMSVLYFKGL